jgi:hypothetical protein
LERSPGKCPTPTALPAFPDVKASEDLDIARHERSLAALSSAMTRFPMESDAWADYVRAVSERLALDVLDGPTAAVPPDVWDYWHSVVDRTNSDYDDAGKRSPGGFIFGAPP